jgi:integrase
LLILTGCRKGELAQAKWTDLHDTMLILTEHKTDKFGEDRIIHLTPRALKIINNLNKDSEYLFTIKNPRRLWERIRSDLKLENFTLHDLRHSYASLALQTLNLSQVGNLLGHKNQATTERYAHIHQDKAVKAAHQVGEHLESLLEPKDFLYQN